VIVGIRVLCMNLGKYEERVEVFNILLIDSAVFMVKIDLKHRWYHVN
jgi:hypothetical protein